MSRKLTYEFVKGFIEDEGCKLISMTYLNNHSPLIIECSCGNEFTTIYDSFKNCNVRTCSECAEKVRKAPKPKETYADIKKFIEIDSNSGCILLTDKQNYKTKKQKLSLVCSCGNFFEVSFENFKRRNKQTCNECAFLIRTEGSKLSFKEVKEYIEGVEGNGCKLISTKYENAQTSLKIQCACGNEYECTMNDFSSVKQKKQCKSCGLAKGGLKRRLTIDFMSEYVEKNSDCKLVTTELETRKDVLTFICKCGKPFNEQFYSFVKSNKCCPSCNRKKPSKGEVVVHDYLEENNYKYAEQHSFSDCKNIIALQYDFAVFNDNSSILCMIEYDGSLHYTTTEFFGGEKRLLLQQKRDKIKDKYCLDNGIPLIRIPYWDFDNIKFILTKELQTLKEGAKENDIA